MRNWYRLTDDLYLPGRWHLRSPVVAGTGIEVDPWAFTRGERYLGMDPLSADCDAGVAMDFTMGGISIPIASPALARVLLDASPNELQLVPVEVAGRPYQILNVLPTVDCIDAARSIATRWTLSDGRPDKLGKFRMIVKLAITPEKLQDASIVRIEGWNVALLVSDAVKGLIEAGGFTGAVFEQIA